MCHIRLDRYGATTRSSDTSNNVLCSGLVTHEVHSHSVTPRTGEKCNRGTDPAARARDYDEPWLCTPLCNRHMHPFALVSTIVMQIV
jgi:hypothetical protein